MTDRITELVRISMVMAGVEDSFLDEDRSTCSIKSTRLVTAENAYGALDNVHLALFKGKDLEQVEKAFGIYARIFHKKVLESGYTTCSSIPEEDFTKLACRDCILKKKVPRKDILKLRYPEVYEDLVRMEGEKSLVSENHAVNSWDDSAHWLYTEIEQIISTTMVKLEGEE